MAVLVAAAALTSALVACSSSNSSTGTSTPSVSSSPSVASSASPAPATFVGTWRSTEGNVLVVGKAVSGYAAALYTDGQKSPLQTVMRERATSLISSGTSSVVSWKLSYDTDLGRLVLSDNPRGVLMFTRVSSSTASPSAQ